MSKYRYSRERATRLSMGYRLLAVPKGWGPERTFNALIDALDADGREPLPRGLRCEWRWRNAPHLPLLSDEFTSTVRNSSRGGFRDIMRARLERDRDLAMARGRR